MGVCYHFQRGTCRFGSSCRFEHVNPSYDSYYNTNESGQYQGDRYHYVKPAAAISQPVKSPPIEASQIFDVVAADTMVAVNGGQWPFSSYGPIKGFQNIVGFEDISPEELRYLMYTAKETGSVDECKRHFNELLQMENMKRTLLMTPSVEADAAIQTIFRSEDQQPLNPNVTSAFHQNQSTLNRTAAESHSASIFGGSSSTGSVFGGSSLATPFPASTNTGSIFQSNASNVFGGGSGGSVFGGGSTSLFGGGGAATQPSGSVFGAAPSGLFSAAAAAVTQQTTGGFFGSAATQPASAQQTTGSFFGATPTQPPSGLFASAASKSVFGEPASVGIFGGISTAQPNAFGAASHTASIFGAKQTSAPTFGSFQSGNELSAKSSVQAGSFQQASDSSSSIYTALSELDDEEKAAFQAKTFTIGKIPVRPPPRELCF